MDYATFELPAPSTLQRLGNGSYGVAYALDDERVLKVTSDALEVQIAKRMVGHTFRRVWNIYFVRALTPAECQAYRLEHGNFRVYEGLHAIIGERLFPMGQKVRAKARYWSNPDKYAPLASWQAEARAELRRIGLDHRDMHSGNMAQTSGGKGKGRPRIKFIDVRAYI